MIDFIDELKWRGLLHQCTDEAALREHLKSGKRRAYVGFDPTADSLTIGNLVTIMMLVHFRRAGHESVVVMGGGTGLIGDPSGKSAERQLMTEERVRGYVEAQRGIFERVFGNAAKASDGVTQRRSDAAHAETPPILNNLDWLGKLSFLEALRDIGKHFSVNMMIQKDSVRERLHNRDQGISYTEFSYMILQSYDYLVLFRDFAKFGLSGPVTLQMGGSDQWGNIVGGGDLIRRFGEHAAPNEGVTREGEVRPAQGAGPLPHGRGSVAFGLTAPLVTKADGGKFGKTESGAIWLSAHRTSPYAIYQFWLNAADTEVGKFLRIFTLLSKDKIESIEAEHAKDPGQRVAQRELARAATSLLHGEAEMQRAEAAARALFSGEISGLSESELTEVFASAPSSEHEKALLAGEGVALVDFLTQTTLVKSKREAKEFLASGSVMVNSRKAGAEDRLRDSDLLHGKLIALRRGKKSWHVTRWK